jgi:hypothetical protein
MSFELRLYNPSDYWRTGHLTIDWEVLAEKTRLDPGKLVVLDSAKNILLHQIDPVFPGKAKLSFTLAEQLLPAGRDDYAYDSPSSCATLKTGKPGAQRDSGEPRPQVIEGEKDEVGRLKGVKLRNEILDVWINLVPAPWGDERSWFAGAVTSVVMKNGPCSHEALDAFDWLYHDPEKRILQVDRLRLPCAAWDSGDFQEVAVFDQPYELIAQSAGPVRATVTLASTPFYYIYTSLGNPTRQKLICRLFRVLSLYAGTDQIQEELFVRGSPDGDLTGKQAVDLTFVASYFSYLRMQGGLRISRFKTIPDWFAVTSGHLAIAQKFHGYGFATDVHASPVEYPLAGYPVPDAAENAFSWSLYPCKAAKCLHRFTFWHPEDWRWSDGVHFWDDEEGLAEVAQHEMESRVGKAWYDSLYKPLYAAL